MKKFTLVILTLTFITVNAFSQNTVTVKDKKKHHDILLRAGVGYAIPQAGQVFGPYTPYSGSINYANGGTTYDSRNLKKASFSSGFQFTLGGKYLFSKHIGFQLDANMDLLPTKYTFYGTNASLTSSRIGNSTVYQQAKRPITLLPALILQTRVSQYTVYGRLGLSLPLYSRVDYTETDVFRSMGPFTNAAETDTYKIQFKSKFNPGFAAALGVSHSLNRKLSFFAELTALSMSLYPAEAAYKNIHIQYQGPIGGFATINQPKLYPTSGSQISRAMPFSNIGINAGLSFRL